MKVGSESPAGPCSVPRLLVELESSRDSTRCCIFCETPYKFSWPPILVHVVGDRVRLKAWLVAQAHGSHVTSSAQISSFFSTMTMLLCSLNHVHAHKEFWTSYMNFALPLALVSMYLRPKSWSWPHKFLFNQEAYFLAKDQIEITRENKYLGIYSFSHGYLEPSSKRRWIINMKTLMTILKKEAEVRVTCWELKSHLSKALVLPILTYDFEICGGDSKNSHWKVLRRAWGYIWYLTSKCILWQPTIFCWLNWEIFPWKYMLLN